MNDNYKIKVGTKLSQNRSDVHIWTPLFLQYYHLLIKFSLQTYIRYQDLNSVPR